MASRRPPASLPSDGNDPFYRGGRAYSFPTDQRGRPALPSFASLDKASTPEDKLAIAGQLADIIQIQADTALRAGTIGRLADLLFRAGQVLNALEAVVDRLGDAESGPLPLDLKRQQRPLIRILTTLHGILRQVVALSQTADPADAARIALRLHQVDGRAATLAARAGLSWQTFQPASSFAIPVMATSAHTLEVLA